MSCPILIVDDDEDVRYLLTVLLTRRGFDVDTFESAASCLERLDTIPACVVVTDVQMPGMSGLDLCAAVRDRHPGTVAIVMSGVASPSLAAEAMDRGAFTFLAKPISASTLDATLHSAMALVEAP
ncbi:MAG TPA: response regulator [Kofleriaceae bacterium]|nr:response regulator [Kofleriaceae bacterium]